MFFSDIKIRFGALCKHFLLGITEERVPFSSNIVEQFTVISDKVRPRSRARNPIYTEEAKIQIYAITGIISCMLLVVLFAATYIMIHKRKERRSRVLSRPHSVTRNPLNENIWNGSENMVSLNLGAKIQMLLGTNLNLITGP